MNFRIVLPIYVKNTIGVWMGIELNLYTALDSMEILPELSFFYS
jgi:hypothetical protein